MNPRSYQTEGVDLVAQAFRSGHLRVIRTAPTGSGKSVEMSIITERAALKGSRVVLLTHRIEIFRSTARHLERSSIPCVELNAKTPLPVGDWRVMVAMQATFWNRVKKDRSVMLAPSLFIVDEGHLEHFTKILQAYPDVHTVTFTASPKGKHLHKLYSSIVQNIDIPDLIEQRYLVPCRAYQMVDKAELDTVKMDGEEFDEDDLFEHFDKSELYEGLLEEYQRFVPGQKGIVFCINIEHTEKTYRILKDAGLNAFIVHSGNKVYPYSDERRAEQVGAFEASSDGIMVNPGILTTGYDHNLIRWIGLYRATTSLSLFLQMCGRGSRPILGEDGRADLVAKSHFTVLDFGSNHTRLGLWNQPRKWKLEDPKKAKKQKAAPVKTCPQCSAMLFASVLLCPYCGQQFEKPTFDTIEGVMVEVDTDIPLGLIGKMISELSIDELISCQKTGKLRASYVWRVLRTKEKDSIENATLGDKRERFLDPYAEKMGYKFGWVANHFSQIDEAGQTGYKNYRIQ